jgi:hypothetical protein
VANFRVVPKLSYANSSLVTGDARKNLKVPVGVAAYDPIPVNTCCGVRRTTGCYKSRAVAVSRQAGSMPRIARRSASLYSSEPLPGATC